jgi:cysteine synthase
LTSAHQRKQKETIVESAGGTQFSNINMVVGNTATGGAVQGLAPSLERLYF